MKQVVTSRAPIMSQALGSLRHAAGSAAAVPTRVSRARVGSDQSQRKFCPHQLEKSPSHQSTLGPPLYSLHEWDFFFFYYFPNLKSS